MDKLGNVSNHAEWNQTIDALTNSVSHLTKEQTLQLLASKKVDEELAQQILVTKGLSAAEAELAFGTARTTAAQQANAGSTLKLSNIYKGLAASTGLSTSALYGMTAATAIFAAGFVIYQQYKKHQEELYQATLDSALATKEAKEQINDYTDTYSKLHKELNDANTSEGRQYEIKKELLALQTELNKKYGEEYGRLNLLTDSYRDQTDSIKDLNKELAQNWLNENENSKGSKDAIEAMTEVKPYSLTYDALFDVGPGSQIKDIAEKLKKEGHGLNVKEIIGTDTFTISLNANVIDANKTIHAFMNEIKSIDGYQDNYVLSSFNDILSHNLSNTSEIIKKYEIVYDEILENRILTNSELSNGFVKAIAAVDNYNEALLSGDTSKIDEASKAIKEVESSIDITSELWSPYKYKLSDIFSQVNTGIYDFKNSLATNKHFTEDTIPQLRGKTASEAKDTKVFQELMDEAKKYELSIYDVISVLREMGIIKKDIAKIKDTSYDPKSLKDQILLLDEMSGKFSEIQKLYAIFNELGSEGLSNDTIASFAKNFEGIDDLSFDKLFSTLKDANASESDIQNAINNFATAYIYSTDCLKGLTEATAEQTIKELELYGVQNANSLVQEALTLQKAEAAWATRNLTEATKDDIEQLAKEAGVADESADAFVNYIVQKMLAQYALDPSGDITALNNIMITLGSASKAWRTYYSARAKMQSYQDSTQEYFQDEDGHIRKREEMIAGEKAKMDHSMKEIQDELSNSTIDVDFKSGYVPPKVPTVPSVGNPRTNSSKKENDKQREQFDWRERKLDIIEQQYKDINDVLKDETKSFYAQEAAIANLITLNEEREKVLEQQRSNFEKNWLDTLGKISDEQLQSLGFDISKEELTKNITQGSMDTSEFVLQKGASDEEKNAFEELIQLIKDTTATYDDLEDTKKKIKETEEDSRKLQKERFQKQIAEIQAENNALKSQQSIIEGEINLLESIGGVVTAGLYEEMIDLSKQQEQMYAEEANAARDRMHEVKNGSEEYYQLMAQIQDCETSILSCQTAQAKWNEEIKRLPIKKLQRYLELLGFIKEDLQNFIDEQSTLGIEANKDQYQQLIDISNEQIDKLLEQQGLLKELLNDYEFNSNKYNKTASEIQDIDDEISSLIQSQREWNKAILQIPINKLTETNDAMQAVVGAMDDIISGYDTAISSVVSAIDKEIDTINDLKDATSDEYEERIKYYQEQLDLLQKQNDERKFQLQLEQAQYDLERARNQKNVATIRNGELVYEADSDAVRNAKESLQDLEYDKTIRDLEDQVSSLEDERDALLESYDEQIERLDTIKNKWADLTKEIQLAAEAVKATEILGEGWQELVLSGNDTAMYDSMKDMYSTIYNQQQQYQDEIASNERIAEMMNQFMEKFQDGSITYEQALSGIDHLVTAMADGFTSMEHLEALLNINGTSDITELLSSMKSSANASVNQFQDYMQIVKANADALNQYTSTWKEMQQLIQEQIEELKRLYEESLKKKQSKSSYSSSSGEGSGSGRELFASTTVWSNGGTYSHSSGETYPSYEEYLEKEGYKTGVLNGYVGDSTNKDSALAAIKTLTTEDIDRDAVPIIAHKNELVLNPDQISKLLQNFGKLNTTIYDPPTIDYSSISGAGMPSNTPDVTINMGNIELPNVEDVNGFAKALNHNFRSIMRQELTK